MCKQLRTTLALVALTIFAPITLQAQPGALQPAPANAAKDPSALAAALALEATVVEAIAKAEPSVVAIARVDPDPRPAIAPNALNGNREGSLQLLRPNEDPDSPDFRPDQFATGIVIDRRGLILTNYHVLKPASEHWVTTADRKRYRARIKGADPRSDLAVLEIDARDLKPLAWGNGAAVKKGQFALALGNPYAIARDGSASAAWGMIANVGRKIPPDLSPESPGRDKLYHYGLLIQTDAKLNLGTSGGALINLRGELIGLTTSLAAMSGYEQAAGYALPVDETFRRVVAALSEGREVEYGFLGVKPENLTAADRELAPHGIRISDVVAGTPAARFGLQPGDILTHLGGDEIRDTDDLVLRVGQYPVESEVPVRLVRNRRTQEVRVELTKFPVRGEKIVTAPAESWRGLHIDYATTRPDDFERASGLPLFREGGVAVTAVEPNTPAAVAGLEAGMFLTAVGEKRIRSPKEFRAALVGQTNAVKFSVLRPNGASSAIESREVEAGN